MEKINDFLQHTRHQYDKGILADNQLEADPLQQFEKWLQEAIQQEVSEPNAMDLCTISNGRPSSRIVLLKGVDQRGFIFYTNYESRKGRSMAENPAIAINFFWQKQARQVRIEGMVEKVSTEESDNYFQSRPRESQIGSWASAQSTVLNSRAELEAKINLIEQQYRGKLIPRPTHWGGYLVTPSKIEFWQGRPNRLHDRFLYEQTPGGWMVCRLSP